MKSVRLDEVATFVRGVTFKPEETVCDYTSNAVACFRTKNVQSDLDQRDLIYLPEQCIRREEQFIRPGDMLMSSANSWNLVGKLCWIPPLTYRATAGGFISILRPKNDKIFPRYLYNWVVYPKTQDRLRNCGRQTTNISNLNFRQALNLDLPLPPLEEQKRIANILDKADTIRRKRQEALRLTDEFLRSVFLEMFGDPVTNPKGWPEVEFGELVRSTKLGMVRSSAEFGWHHPVPYVRMDALTNGGAFLSEKVQGTQASGADIEAYGLEAGDFLFNTRNSKELVGKVAVYPGPDGATFNNNLMRIRFNGSTDPYFICQQFQFPRIQRELETRKQGTTSVFAVYWKNLETLPILCPPKELQGKFRDIVNKVMDSKKTQCRFSSTSKDLFASFQQLAFSGELFQ